jgi:hypothetical protein
VSAVTQPAEFREISSTVRNVFHYFENRTFHQSQLFTVLSTGGGGDNVGAVMQPCVPCVPCAGITFVIADNTKLHPFSTNCITPSTDAGNNRKTGANAFDGVVAPNFMRKVDFCEQHSPLQNFVKATCAVWHRDQSQASSVLLLQFILCKECSLNVIGDNVMLYIHFRIVHLEQPQLNADFGLPYVHKLMLYCHASIIYLCLAIRRKV